jgi:hypothetical protein
MHLNRKAGSIAQGILLRATTPVPESPTGVYADPMTDRIQGLAFEDFASQSGLRRLACLAASA